MKTIAEIIEEWKSIRVPIVEGCEYAYEKDCDFEENPQKPTECKITMILRDKYTHRNGQFAGWSQVNVFLTEHQNGEPTLKAIENEMFYQALQKFTEDGVKFRRTELQSLMNAGESIMFYPAV